MPRMLIGPRKYRRMRALTRVVIGAFVVMMASSWVAEEFDSRAAEKVLAAAMLVGVVSVVALFVMNVAVSVAYCKARRRKPSTED